jgi:hypothetical protein
MSGAPSLAGGRGRNFVHLSPSNIDDPRFHFFSGDFSA